MPIINKTFSKSRKLLFTLITVFISLLIVLFFGEIMLRGYRYIKSKNTPTKTIIPDQLLGWKAAENYLFKQNTIDSSNYESPIYLSTDKNGFREFGKINTTKKKILFIGDSFTHAIEVSDNKTYYHLLGDTLNASIFAYGCGGYGTLQEYLFLEKYIDTINPDLIVLQFCSNDFINNSYALKKNSFFNNSRLTRPYFTADEKIVYKNTARFHTSLLEKYSQFIPFITTRIERISDYKMHKAKKSSEDLILIEKDNYPPFQEAVTITEKIIKKITKLVAGRAELLVFAVDYYEPYSKALKDNCEANHIRLTEAVPYYLKLKMDEGINVYAPDGAHWNEEGHKIAAQVLLNEFFNKTEDQ